MPWKWVLITVEKFMINNERILIGFRRIPVVAESAPPPPHARQFARMYQRGPH
jgi:hypothetical protein